MNVAAVWQLFLIFNSRFVRFDLSSVRMPGPAPHPGFQKQQFNRNVGYVGGVRGRPFRPHPADFGGPAGSRAGIKKYIFFQLLPEGSHEMALELVSWADSN
jgi:hypothetical protein